MVHGRRAPDPAQQSWPAMGPETRGAALDAILEAVPATIPRRVAPQTAALYNQVQAPRPPTELLGLRIAMRQRATEQGTETTKETVQEAQSESNGTSSEGKQQAEGEQTEAAAEPPVLTRACRRQLSTIPTQEREKKRRQERAPSSSAGSQTQPRRRQGQIPHRKQKTIRQMQAETATVEPVDLEEEEPAGRKHNQATQTGARRRIAAEEPQNETIARQDDWRQWLPQEEGQVQEGEGEAEGEENIGLHEATTQPYTGCNRPEPGVWGPNQVQGADGRPRAPTSQEKAWMEEYEREKEEQQRMDELLADFEEEELLEIARQEYEEEELRKEVAAANTEFDSESS